MPRVPLLLALTAACVVPNRDPPNSPMVSSRSPHEGRPMTRNKSLGLLLLFLGCLGACADDPETGAEATHAHDEEEVAMMGAAAAMPRGCSNGIKGRRETDVDCGGPDCPRCAVGKVCGRNEDCASATCESGFCVDTPDPGGDAPTCEEYCTTLQAACTDSSVTNQFYDEEECNTYCLAVGWEAGTAGDTTGNTIACRLTHAERAASATGATPRAAFCDVAGSSGGNVCGSWCTVLCNSALTLCTGRNEVYTDEATCLTACGAIADTPNGTYGYADPNYLYWDTVQCRIRHLRSAVEHSAAVHCPHASAASEAAACGDTSTPNCAHYCDTLSRYCTSGSYGSVSACMTQCDTDYFATGATGEVGQHYDTSGNTLGCRINQAEWATDCDSADRDGGTVCQ